MDFITGLPKVKGFDAVLMVLDTLSKSRHFIAIRHARTAKDMAEIFIWEIVHLHGFPCTIIIDRDRIFMSHFWMEF